MKKLSSYFRKGESFAKPSPFGKGNRKRRIPKTSGKSRFAVCKASKKMKDKNQAYSMIHRLTAEPVEDGYVIALNKCPLKGAVKQAHVVTNKDYVESMVKQGKDFKLKYKLKNIRVIDVEKEGNKFLCYCVAV